MRFTPLVCVLAGVLVLHGVAAAAEKPAPFIAWGKPVNGLQAGLRLRHADVTPGAVVELDVVVRNVGQKKITVRYTPALYFVGEDRAGTVSARAEFAYGGYFPPGAYLAPELPVGKEHTIARMAIHRADDRDALLKRTKLGPGTYRVGIDRFELGVGKDETAELATGYLDVAVPAEKR